MTILHKNKIFLRSVVLREKKAAKMTIMRGPNVPRQLNIGVGQFRQSCFRPWTYTHIQSKGIRLNQILFASAALISKTLGTVAFLTHFSLFVNASKYSCKNEIRDNTFVFISKKIKINFFIGCGQRLKIIDQVE